MTRAWFTAKGGFVCLGWNQPTRICHISRQKQRDGSIIGRKRGVFFFIPCPLLRSRTHIASSERTLNIAEYTGPGLHTLTSHHFVLLSGYVKRGPLFLVNASIPPIRPCSQNSSPQRGNLQMTLAELQAIVMKYGRWAIERARREAKDQKAKLVEATKK